MKHTPTPWKWYWRLGDDLKADCGILYRKMDGHAYSVARCPQYQGEEQWKADAAFIVQAVNEFDNFIVACEDALNELQNGGHREKTISALKGILARTKQTLP